MVWHCFTHGPNMTTTKLDCDTGKEYTDKNITSFCVSLNFIEIRSYVSRWTHLGGGGNVSTAYCWSSSGLLQTMKKT